MLYYILGIVHLILFLIAAVGAFVTPRAHRYWVYFLALILGFFWFGSASLSQYQPLPFEGRMITPALPGLRRLGSCIAPLHHRSRRHGRQVAEASTMLAVA